MRMPDKADILVPVQVPNTVQGGTTTKYVYDRTIRCSFQPISYNAMYKPFGITDTTSNIVYCTDFNIKADNRIKSGNYTYKIDSIQAWKKHNQVALTKVVG